MKKTFFIVLMISLSLLSGCGKKEEPSEDIPTGSSASSMFNGQSGTPEPTPSTDEQLPSGDTVDLGGGNVTQTPTIPGPGMFDDIPDTISTEGQGDLEGEPTTQKSPREQLIALTDEWGLSIPAVNIELFKMAEGELFERIGEQFPISLRYVWGQPKTRMEAVDGGYKDIWEIGSEDGSFKGRILVSYDGKDEVRATITGALTEVLIDDKDLTGKLSQGQSSSGTGLEVLWERMNDPSVTADAVNADLAELTYEEAIIQWGRSDHRADDGAYCWRVGDNFICISFDDEGKYVSYRIENFFT